MSYHRLRVGITAGLAVTAWLSGCAQSTEANPSPTSSSAQSVAAAPSSDTTAPPTTLAPRTVNWTALNAGDCLADAPPTDPAVVMVTLVDCSQPHLAEVFLRQAIPVDAALDGTANDRCQAGYTQYTGTSPAGSPYAITYLIDSDQDRTFNNPLPSTVICLLQNAKGEQLTGSARH